MKIAFKTYGCKANSVDTDALHHAASRLGWDVVPEQEPADAYVINSCTVTEAADKEARIQAQKYKKRNPNSKVGIVGCYSQVAERELLDVDEIDLIVGSADKEHILDLLEQQARGQTVDRGNVKKATGFLRDDFPGSRLSRASIKIQDGCNFKCSYCIIPQARGRSRSLSPDRVIAQIRQAHGQGFREVTLTGIHIAHYGWDLNTDLMELLHRIFVETEGVRVRLTTLDPFEIPDALIALMESEPRLCPHFHIAIQSGSDAVLKGMRRIYRAHEFVEVSNKIHAALPHAFIGVDVIVGFPGEGTKEFEETEENLRASHWTRLHVFPFSLRKDTPAEALPHKVEPAEIQRRSRELRAWSDARHQEFLESQLGRVCDVIVEKKSRQFPSAWKGHTENYLPTFSLAHDQTESRNLVRSKIVQIKAGRAWTVPV